MAICLHPKTSDCLEFSKWFRDVSGGDVGEFSQALLAPIGWTGVLLSSLWWLGEKESEALPVKFSKVFVSIFDSEDMETLMSFFRWWQLIDEHLHPYLIKIPVLTIFFQVGWNHHLDVFLRSSREKKNGGKVVCIFFVGIGYFCSMHVCFCNGDAPFE